MQGDKNIIRFEGDHNSPRPQFYYDSVSIFFYNVLHPPQISTTCSSKVEKYYDLGGLKIAAGTDEVISRSLHVKLTPERGSQFKAVHWNECWKIKFVVMT